MVVITKIDICPPQILQQTIVQLTKILKSPGARKIPIFIKNHEETINTAVSLLKHLSTCQRPANVDIDAIRQPPDMSRLPGLQRYW